MSQSIFIAGTAGGELTGLAKGLKNYGYEMEVHEGGGVLDALFKGSAPSAIILDSLLEGATTLEVCQKVKQSKRYAKIPLLIIKDGQFRNDEYLAIGVKNFIDRPVSPARIHEAIGLLMPTKKVDKTTQKQKVIWTMVAIGLFLAFLTYWVFIPMFVGSK